MTAPACNMTPAEPFVPQTPPKAGGPGIAAGNCATPRRFAAGSDGDSLDWKGISAQEITRRVVSNVEPGSIVLFHNAAKHTPEALPGILESLISKGYTIVPISKLIYGGTYHVDYTIDHTGRQFEVKGNAARQKTS